MAEMDLRELVARALFQEKFRLRRWDGAAERSWQKKHCYERADEAIRRAGVKAGTCRVEMLPERERENVR